jgi:hypothetical protein
VVRRLFKDFRRGDRYVDDSDSRGEEINVLRGCIHICLEGLRTLWDVTPKFESVSPNTSQICYSNTSHSVCVVSNERKGP